MYVCERDLLVVVRKRQPSGSGGNMPRVWVGVKDGVTGRGLAPHSLLQKRGSILDV